MREVKALPLEEEIAAYLSQRAKRIHCYLESVFSSGLHPKELFDAMNYSLLAGGKRLRPVLCIATAEAFGAATDDTLSVAAAIEMIHTYSLIHDDLPSMDDDDLRRGRPTNHKVFGEGTALLAGDGLLTYAFEHLAEPLPIPAERQLRILWTLARAAGSFGMVGGQMADVLAEGGRGDVSDLQFIHTHKTAKLIQASVVIGGLFSGCSEDDLQSLGEFSLRLGLAFQMVDDLLDVRGTAEQLGKTPGSDERMGKLTYPSLLGAEATESLAKQQTDAAIQALHQVSGADTSMLEGIARYLIRRNN